MGLTAEQLREGLDHVADASRDRNSSETRRLSGTPPAADRLPDAAQDHRRPAVSVAAPPRFGISWRVRLARRCSHTSCWRAISMRCALRVVAPEAGYARSCASWWSRRSWTSTPSPATTRPRSSTHPHQGHRPLVGGNLPAVRGRTPDIWPAGDRGAGGPAKLLGLPERPDEKATRARPTVRPIAARRHLPWHCYNNPAL